MAFLDLNGLQIFLRKLDERFATKSHTHSQYYDSTVSRAANTVLAAPNGSNGGASFRKLVAADIPTLTRSKISDFPSSMPASDVYSWAKASSKPSYNYNEISGTVPSSALPSYVDDVLEGYLSSDGKFYRTLSNGTYSNPYTGETGKIYVNLSNNKTYRWSGSAYAVISETLALGETSSTAYRGDRGAAAYAHTGNTNNPHNVTKSQIGLGNVENKSSATIRGELTKENVTTALGYTPPTTNTVYTHPTSSGNKHIPSGGTYSQILRWSADGTAKWDYQDRTVDIFSSSSSNKGKWIKFATVNLSSAPAWSGCAGTLDFVQTENNSLFLSAVGTLKFFFRTGSTAGAISTNLLNWTSLSSPESASSIAGVSSATGVVDLYYRPIYNNDSTRVVLNNIYSGQFFSFGVGSWVSSITPVVTSTLASAASQSFKLQNGSYGMSAGSDGYITPIGNTYIGKSGAPFASAYITSMHGTADAANSVPWSGVTGKPSSMPASDVYSWAKASAKPSYSWGEITGKPSFATVATSGNYNDLSNRPTIPTTLRNPNALTIQLNGSSQGAYDGSAAKTINVTPSSIGAAASSHSHSYVPLSGGTITGPIKRAGAGSNISARDNVAVSGTSYGQPSGNSFNCVVGQKTDSGYWVMGSLSGSNDLMFQYTTDANYNAGNNTVSGAVTLPVTTGQIALTSQIPSVGNGTVTITQNGATKGSFTLNQSGNATIALTDNNTTYGAATTSAAGLMSASDKQKLDGISASADTVSFTRSLSSGTKVGTITINGTATDIYCNNDTNTTYSAITDAQINALFS